jgi:SAM-dependent methyltransferase
LNVFVRIAEALLTVGAAAFLLGQCRKPRGWLGRAVILQMNRRHAQVTAWGLAHVNIEKNFTILDVGCGGGRTISMLAAVASDGKVSGVDHSAASVEAARQSNVEAITSGRVHVEQASVSRLPFPDQTFDLVTAVETHYYWPDPVADMREILRVLKPGGSLAVIAETHRNETRGWFLALPMMLLRARYLTDREHADLLIAAGFDGVAIDRHSRKGWICSVGRKPADK